MRTPSVVAFTCLALAGCDEPTGLAPSNRRAPYSYGVVRIETVSTGYFGRAIDNYRAELSPEVGSSQPVITKQVPANGVAHVSPVAGVVYVRLVPFPDACGVLGPRKVTVATGGLALDTAIVQFVNDCDG